MKSLLKVLLILAPTSLSAITPVPAEVRPERIPGGKPRNVVFILSDDHRYDAMSFLGHQFAKTPVIDSIAANGAYIKKRTRHYCPLFAQPSLNLNWPVHVPSSRNRQQPHDPARDGVFSPISPERWLRDQLHRQVAHGR